MRNVFKVQNKELELKVENLNTVNSEINNIKKEIEKQNKIVLGWANKGIKFEPNTKVRVLNDFYGSDGSPIVAYTDAEGNIKNIDIDAVEDIARFENMSDEQQMQHLEKKRKEAVMALNHIDNG